MLIHQTPLLLPDILSLRPKDKDFDPAPWRLNEEVVVRQSAGEILLRQDERTVALALTPRSGAAESYAEESSTIWVLVQAKKTVLGFRCGRPSEAHRPQQPIDIGIDQRVADDLHLQRKIAEPTATAAIEWLTDEFVCRGVEAGLNRVFAARIPRAKQHQLQLIGRAALVDVERNREGHLVVQRIRPRSRSGLDAYTVIEGDICFADLDQGLRVQSGDERATLGAAVTSYGTYLELWQLYSEAEWRREVAKAAAVGALRYAQVEPASLEGGAWRFLAKPDDIAEFRTRWRENNVEPDESLEAEDAAPDWRSDRYSDLSAADSTRRFRGIPEFHQDAVIVTAMSRSDPEPPSTGYLFLSLGGDRKQHERRLRARTAIEAGVGVPRLRSLLQDLPISGQRPSRHVALTPYARQTFKSGKPTAKQEEAIHVALNTPDVALIIGPPGTGKTQVIAALERRLAEINEGNTIAHEVLVSSFQHDAVENALERTSVYGLPAVKVGRRNGLEDAVDRWCRAQLASASERLVELAATEPHVPLLEELNRLIVALQFGAVVPARRDEAFTRITDILDQLADLVRLRVSSLWRQDWDDYLAQTRALGEKGNQGISIGRRKRLVALVRRLRTLPESFDDDGPIRAAMLLQALESEDAALLTEDERALLRAAADDGDKSTDFWSGIDSLRNALLDRLRVDKRPSMVRAQMDSIGAALLTRLQDEIATTIATRRFGRYDVLRRYRDSLDSNPGRIRRAVEQYSSIVGATCQQAASHQMSRLKSVNADAVGSIQFTTVIVDEAARANPLDLFIPMSMAKRRIVLVGDHRQLPHLLDPEVEEDVVRLHGEEDRRAVYAQSLFERLWHQLKAREALDGFSRVVMLDKQFRMHPTLGDFVSRNFYESAGLGRVESGRKEEDFPGEVPGFGEVVSAWIDVPASKGHEERHRSSKQRRSEAARVALEVRRLLQELPASMSVGVITFYSAQRDRIYEELAKFEITQRTDAQWRIAPEHASTPECPERLRIGTVDAFQGKEFDVVLLSTVRSNELRLEARNDADDAAYEKAASRKYGHLRVDNRLNVAMSRQRRILIAVGDRAMFVGDAAARAVPEMSAFVELCDSEARRVR